MRVRDVMTTPPITVQASDNLSTAMQRMGKNYRRLLVVDEEEKLLGIITDRDLRLAMNSPYILRERWQDEQLLVQTQVANCMTANPAVVQPDTPLASAIEIMLKGRFSGLPVVDEAQRVVGVVSVTDILKAFHRHLTDQSPE